METIYLHDNGLLLKRRSERIVVKKEGKVVEEIPLLDVKRVLVFGNNQVSTQLMRHLAKRGVELAFLSTQGRFKFRLVPQTSKNIYLRMAQHDCYRNNDFRIRWSKAIVKAKVTNQRALLVRYQRNQPGIELQPVLSSMLRSIESIDEKASVDEIMGVEGHASKKYFEGYGRLLMGGFTFLGRAYHPPPDPVNAMLSFGYMLLFNELESLLESFGFDCFLGFLHSTRYGRASLATDLIEELRSPVVDRMVLYLTNKGMVKPSEFEVDETKGVRMKDEVSKAIIRNYEKFMTSSFIDVKSRERVTYRQIVRERVREAEKVVMEKRTYRPYLFYS